MVQPIDPTTCSFDFFINDQMPWRGKFVSTTPGCWVDLIHKVRQYNAILTHMHSTQHPEYEISRVAAIQKLNEFAPGSSQSLDGIHQWVWAPPRVLPAGFIHATQEVPAPFLPPDGY